MKQILLVLRSLGATIKVLSNNWGVVGIILFLILNSAGIYAKDGDLDLTFNKTGKVILSGNQFAIAYATLVQSDEKVVVVGTIDTNFAVIRLNVDGSLDKIFGSGGKVILPIINVNSLREANVLQNNGKIVITGVSNDQFVVVRLDSNGTLDSTFGAGGIVQFTFGFGIDSNAIQLQKDGKIVIGGDSYSGRALNIVRFEKNGKFDPTFPTPPFDINGPGKVLIKFDLNAFGRGLAIQNDGKILICGNISGFFSVLRLQSNGALDLNFGPFGLGYVTIVGGSFASANSIFVQPDQKIVIGGQADYKFALVRLNTDGSLDKTFNGSGIVQTSIGQNSPNTGITSIALQPWDNKIVVAGISVFTTQKFTLARYTNTGKLDTTFGNNGFVITNFGPQITNDGVNSVAIDTFAKKIVAAGYTGNNIAVARYIGNSCLPADTFIQALVAKYG